MSGIKGRKNYNNPADRVQKCGAGITEGDQILNTFARKADLSLQDARALVTGEVENFTGKKGKKAETFKEAVSEEYGDIRTFAQTYKNADQPALKL